ncbi:putative major cell surface glycoprotein [Candidatus Nanohalobium constans]|uniref:Putative major cell surface glycoprotein n=1 Tax=Candidatus Nanohalobium constans TaxID=2565781 RepID=A0A5Q0UHI1_9ARCH|nr:putative major cell surface glycoprotein [Candidatus Nanohalobium constans]
MPSIKQKTFFLLTVCILATTLGSAASNWSIYDNTGLNTGVVSADSPTVQVVNITADTTDTTLTPDDDTAYPVQLTPDYLSENYNITAAYNATNGTDSDLTHLKNGMWYTKFTPNNTAGNKLLFSANGTTTKQGVKNSNEEANITKTLNIGDYTVELQDKYDKPVKAGMEFELEAVVTDQSDNVKDDSEASVEAYFTNPDETTTTTKIDNYEAGEFYNSRVNYPDNPNSTYLMHVKAINDTTGDTEGTTSRIIDIAPQVKGEITGFDAEGGCGTQEEVSSCEQGATIDIEYSITSAEAENVNLSIFAFNNSGRTRLDTMNLTEDSSTLFSGSVQVPDINTSKYDKEIEFKFNATNRNRESVDRRNITLNTFTIDDRSSATTYLGKEYELNIFLGKPFSLDDYSMDRFNNIEVDIDDSNGTNYERFTMNNLSYSETEGVVTASTVIDEDNPTGSYSLEITAENNYGEEKTEVSGFSVKDADATFETEENIEVEVNRLEPATFNIEAENLLQQENELEAEVTELEDQITINDNPITLQPEEDTDIEIEINLTELNDKEGEIKFTDASTNYNQTTEIEIDTPDCNRQAGNLCLESRDDIDVTAGTTSEFTETIDLRYIGEQDGSVTYNTTIEGEISPYLSIENESEDTELSGSKEVTVTFQPEATGTYTGDIVFDTESGEELTVPTTLNYQPNEDENSNEQNKDISISADPTSLDLGYLQEGSSTTKTVTITNNGEDTSESLSITSDDYTVTSSFQSQLAAGNTQEITLNFEDVEEENGRINLDIGETTSITVTANIVTNRASSLRDRKSRLQSQVESGSTQQQDLTEISAQISNYETALTAENYEEAQETYQEIDSTLQRISSETTTTPPDNPGEENNENSGGLPILPIAGAVIALLLIGFIFYESYIPEEGDPLYSVLGE